jgi:hypothetical protein
MICFTTNDLLKQKVLNKCRKDGDEFSELSVLDSLVIGVASTLIGAVIAHPAAVINTRMMTQGASAAIPYLSTMDCTQSIIKTEGFASFFSGWVQRSLYIGSLWALLSALNGRAMQVLDGRNHANKPSSSEHAHPRRQQALPVGRACMRVPPLHTSLL